MQRSLDSCERVTPTYGQNRRQPDSLDKIVKAREKRALFRIERPEFTRRQRYRDTDGNAYAPALSEDALYKMLERHNLVDPLDDDDAQRAALSPCGALGLPKPSQRVAVDQAGTIGTHYGRAAFYVEMKADGKLHKWPSGELEFVDPNTQRLFTGTVEKSIFAGRSKGGYVVLRDVVDWGRLASPSDFSRVSGAPQAKRQKR